MASISVSSSSSSIDANWSNQNCLNNSSQLAQNHNYLTDLTSNNNNSNNNTNNNYSLPNLQNQHTGSNVERFRSVLSNLRVIPYSTNGKNSSNNTNNSSNNSNNNNNQDNDMPNRTISSTSPSSSISRE